MNYKHKTSPFTILLRIVFTGCLLYSMVFIFQNSLEIAAVSSQRSEQIQQIINQIAGKVGLAPFSLHLIRKLAHFAEFMMMGFWFMLCLRVYTRHFIKHISWPLLLGLGTAVCDETIQLFVDGRGSSVKDIWIDFAGFVTGLFVSLFILMFFRMCAILFVHRNDDRITDREHPAMQTAYKESPKVDATQRTARRMNGEAPRQGYSPEIPLMESDEVRADENWQELGEEDTSYDTNILY